MMESSTERIMTRTETASALGVHVDTLIKWSQRGYGPRPLRLGERKVVYRHTEVQDFLANLEPA